MAIRQKINSITAMALTIHFLCSAVFALNIEGIDIWHSKDYYDGVPVNSSPWDFGVNVRGTGITSVSVTSQNGNILHLEDIGDGEWEVELGNFNSETEWLTDYPMGNYTFSFNGGSDSVVLVHDEALPGGIAVITFPSNNATNVSYNNPVFKWNSCIGLGEELSLQVDSDFLDSIFTANYASDVRSVSVSGLLPARHYNFGIDLDNTTNGNRTTVGGDSFAYRSRTGYYNEVEFRTKPIPGDLQADGRVGLLDMAVLAQNWLVISGNIFNSNSATITNPLLGLTNIGDSYSMSGYGTEAGAERSYSLIGTETVMGVNCLILKIFGYGEMPRTDYIDLCIAQDIGGNIRILKVTGFDEGGQMDWQSEEVNFSPIFLPSVDHLDIGKLYPLWEDNYNEVIAVNQTVPVMSTGTGPYTGCVQYNWNSDDSEGGIDVDENYICPGFGYVKEVWNDGELGGWERNP